MKKLEYLIGTLLTAAMVQPAQAEETEQDLPIELYIGDKKIQIPNSGIKAETIEQEKIYTIRTNEKEKALYLKITYSTGDDTPEILTQESFDLTDTDGRYIQEHKFTIPKNERNKRYHIVAQIGTITTNKIYQAEETIVIFGDVVDLEKYDFSLNINEEDATLFNVNGSPTDEKKYLYLAQGDIIENVTKKIKKIVKENIITRSEIEEVSNISSQELGVSNYTITYNDDSKEYLIVDVSTTAEERDSKKRGALVTELANPELTLEPPQRPMESDNPESQNRVPPQQTDIITLPPPNQSPAGTPTPSETSPATTTRNKIPEFLQASSGAFGVAYRHFKREFSDLGATKQAVELYFNLEPTFSLHEDNIRIVGILETEQMITSAEDQVYQGKYRIGARIQLAQPVNEILEQSFLEFGATATGTNTTLKRNTRETDQVHGVHFTTTLIPAFQLQPNKPAAFGPQVRGKLDILGIEQEKQLLRKPELSGRAHGGFYISKEGADFTVGFGGIFDRNKPTGEVEPRYGLEALLNFHIKEMTCFIEPDVHLLGSPTIEIGITAGCDIPFTKTERKTIRVEAGYEFTQRETRSITRDHRAFFRATFNAGKAPRKR